MSGPFTPIVSQMKRVLVTGANKGIGKAICAKILDDSANTSVILASRDKARGAAAVQELELVASRKGRVSLLELDVTDKASVESAARTVKEMLASEGAIALA